MKKLCFLPSRNSLGSQESGSDFDRGWQDLCVLSERVGLLYMVMSDIRPSQLDDPQDVESLIAEVKKYLRDGSLAGAMIRRVGSGSYLSPLKDHQSE